MRPQLNLACNIKLTEQDEKYKHIQSYIFFRELTQTITTNHKRLIADLENLQDLNFSTDQSSIFEKRSQVQNSLLNLLNSHKLFIDLLERKYKNTNPKMYRRLKTVLSHHYDEDFSYKIFEHLRNYCQHANTIPMDIFSDLEGMTYIFINKQELSKDKKIYSKISRELDSPLPIELNATAKEWLSATSHIYGIVLDYFSYKSTSYIEEYRNQISKDTVASRSDPLISEIMKSVEIKVIKKRMLFPILPDPRLTCDEILERLDSTDLKNRYSKVKDIYLNMRSSKKHTRRMKKIGIKFDFKFDDLFIRNINKFLNDEDPF